MAVELFDSARKYQNEKVLLIRCRGDTFTSGSCEKPKVVLLSPARPPAG